MMFGTITHEAARPAAGQIDPDRDTLADVRIGGIDQALACMQVTQGPRIEERMAAPEADLRQARPFAHQDRECARAYFGIKWSMVTSLDAVETTRLIGDHAREYIEPSGRAFWVGGRRNFIGQRQAFLQWHNLEAASFDNRSLTQQGRVTHELD